jgi:rare lipoprotein A
MQGLTAANWDYPFGTRLRVTNLINKKSVIVRVNDRGPGIPGRVIDLSMAAAKRLGFIRAGVTPVQVEVVHLAKQSAKDGTLAGAPRLSSDGE